MAYRDTRLGGVERWYARRPEDANMRVPSNITNCVCFLGFKAKGGEQVNKFISIGTGFFVGVQDSDWDFLYLVTARHVVDEAKRLNLMPLYARINTHNKGVQLIALNNDWAMWQNPAVDVAVMPAPIPPDIFKYEALPMRMLATDEKIDEHGVGLGDELLAVGLFTSHTGKAEKHTNNADGCYCGDARRAVYQ